VSTTVETSVELVRSLFAAFGRGDIKFIVDHVTPDVKWTSPAKGYVPTGGTYNGPEGVARFFQVLNETEQITFFEVREFFTKEDDVVVLGEVESRSVETGKAARSHWSMLFRVRDGKVYEWEELFDTVLAAEAHRRAEQ
jgi:ketosteroid isomerase-like protein